MIARAQRNTKENNQLNQCFGWWPKFKASGPLDFVYCIHYFWFESFLCISVMIIISRGLELLLISWGLDLSRVSCVKLHKYKQDKKVLHFFLHYIYNSLHWFIIYLLSIWPIWPHKNQRSDLDFIKIEWLSIKNSYNL